jgi:hypothetical protein
MFLSFFLIEMNTQTKFCNAWEELLKCAQELYRPFSCSQLYIKKCMNNGDEADMSKIRGNALNNRLVVCGVITLLNMLYLISYAASDRYPMFCLRVIDDHNSRSHFHDKYKQ